VLSIGGIIGLSPARANNDDDYFTEYLFLKTGHFSARSASSELFISNLGCCGLIGREGTGA